MPDTPHQPTINSREEQARLEIGATDIRRPVAGALTVFFLALIGIGMVAAWVPASFRSGLRALLVGTGTLKSRIVQFESALNRDFPAAVALRTPVQTALAALGAGDAQVAIGKDDWLFYAPDVTALTGRGVAQARRLDRAAGRESPAIEAARAFHEALAARGIRLVLLPTPVKPGVHPEKLHPASRLPEPVLRTRGFDDWADAVGRHGCEVFDAAPALAEVRTRNGAAYLNRDTHWTPAAMDAVAAAVAATLRPDLPPFNPAPAGAPPLAVTHTGDTAMMLALPSGHRLRRPEGVVIHPVEGAASDAADVLLLGDSFSNIYSLHGMGWGSGAGFAERLALHLGRPVRAFVRNDGGAWGSRDRLARALARGDATLEGVRVVVWQFSDRELAHGDWKTIGIPEAAPRPRRSAPSTAGAIRTVDCTGLLEAASSGPRLDAPYSDFIIKWHVTGLVAASGARMSDAAVVMLFGMQKRTLLPAASLRPGGRVSLRLRPWEEVEKQYGTLNAGSMDDPMLEIDLPLFWSEEAQAESNEQGQPHRLL